ncbi:hypothetical protein [Kyrpidia sp.]|uniref:hypothetical protein n=1 Tax=Kyrpidia sp. TaxID=2073077 RepID=UPI0025904998|nr:hypothetical protein [Kyrpidia sp.]MCL6577651.1 hypothetical protein [Kyrpidia sp.]
MLREKENVTVLLRSTWAVCVSDTDPNGLSTFAVISYEPGSTTLTDAAGWPLIWYAAPDGPSILSCAVRTAILYHLKPIGPSIRRR